MAAAKEVEAAARANSEQSFTALEGETDSS